MFKDIVGKTILRNSLTFFYFKLFLIWLSWKLIINILGEQHVDINDRYFPAISQAWENMNNSFAFFIAEQSASFLNLMGYEAYSYERLVWIINHSGVAIGNYCLGFQLMYYFTFLIFLSSLKFFQKGIAIISGLFIIHTLNMFRVIGLNLILVYKPSLMAISHDLYFNILVFGVLISFYYYITKD